MTVGLSDRAPGRFARAALVRLWRRCRHVPAQRHSWPSHQYLPIAPNGSVYRHGGRQRELVEFCPAEPFATLAIVRGYRDPGNCRDGAAPLLKPVVAKSGDVVELSARGFPSMERFSPTRPRSRRTPKAGILEAWPFGRYVVAPETSGWRPHIIHGALTAVTLARFRCGNSSSG